jgi:hypothetical protein
LRLRLLPTCSWIDIANRAHLSGAANARNVSTTWRQPAFEFKLGWHPESAQHAYRQSDGGKGCLAGEGAAPSRWVHLQSSRRIRGRNRIGNARAGWWDNWARLDPNYSPAPYAQHAAALTSLGDRDAANEIRHLGRVRERETERGFAFVWSGILQDVAGFGIGTHTFRVPYWVIGITFLGAHYLRTRVKGSAITGFSGASAPASPGSWQGCSR